MRRRLLRGLVLSSVVAGLLVGCRPETRNETIPKAAPLPQVAHADPDAIGILLGDSVVRGFGGGPVLYNSSAAEFEAKKYRFRPEEDLPIEALRGYQGAEVWLNRGVTGNPSNAVVARWEMDVLTPQDRGAQTRSQHVTTVLVSMGITDIGAALGTPRLPKAEANLQQNFLRLTALAKAAGIHIAFLEIPDPTCAPLGESFHTLAGTPVKSFCEEQNLSPADQIAFTEAVLRTRKFMETEVRAAGAEVIDYADFLPPEYFWDSHHPSDPGYVELGRLLRSRSS